jgi:exoribonuclease-2
MFDINEGQEQLAFLFRLAKHLKARREVVRGKPENFNRPDYQFRLESSELEPSVQTTPTPAKTPYSGPHGNERVIITERQRGSALDLIVAEAMILANSTWGQWMAELSVPAIYRSQASMLPGVKVRMGTKALPHAGIGVPCYAWSTSPLRRYTDLVNQWQLIACATHGNTAALVAPFKPKDVELFAIISSFEATYSAYNGYQASMERFWTLKYIEQENIQELNATVIKNLPGQPIMVRALDLPMVMPVLGNTALVRGEVVRVRLQGIDLISLDIQAQFLESLEKPTAPSASQGAASHASPPGLDAQTAQEEDSDDSMSVGPLHIAVDMENTEASEKAVDTATD